MIADGILVATPAGSTAYNLSVQGPILPINAALLALTPISAFRPRRWRGALLPNTAYVVIEVLESEKRPVAAVADHDEARDVRRVEVLSDKTISMRMLFDPGHSLEERILREQFGSDIKQSGLSLTPASQRFLNPHRRVWLMRGIPSFGLGRPCFASTSTSCDSWSATTIRTCAASCGRCCIRSARARSMRPRTARPRSKCTRHYVPDIVITDWSMPIFDGLELAQMIRQPESKGNPFAPIIMLTGHSEKRRVTVARDAGVTEFLAKPISAKGLYQRILNVVANPRPFIKTKTYFGPDRRRNTTNAYIGPERRIGGEVEVLQQPSLLDKARSAV